MENLSQRVNQISNKQDARNLSLLLQDVYREIGNVALNSSGIVIKAASNALAKNGASFYASVEGKLVNVPINTDTPAFTGTVTNTYFNVYVWVVDKDGNRSFKVGTQGATLGAVKMPEISTKTAIIGIIIINPSATGFTGGTSPLDGTQANAVYLSPTGAISLNAVVSI